MTWWYIHVWVEVARTYAPPSSALQEVKGVDADVLMKQALFGVTTILWRCDTCGAFRKDELLGKEHA